MELFTEPTRLMELAAHNSWTLFRGGAAKREEEAKKAALEEAVMRYERLVLGALKGVEGCLLELSSWQKVLPCHEASA